MRRAKTARALATLALLAGASCALATAGRRVPAQAPRIFPVYAVEEGWLLLDRRPHAAQHPFRPGTRFLVVGSQSAAAFSVRVASTTWTAACRRGAAAPTQAYFLQGPGMEGVGTPVIALPLPRGVRLDASRARFTCLGNQVGEDVYAALTEPLRAAALEELGNGEFKPKADDAYARASAPKPEQLQIRIDFGSSISLAGAPDAFVLADTAQISKSSRRCLRLVIQSKPVGRCAEMPSALMAGTDGLEFVAYDPNGSANPFVLAYTTREPLWGHERWGFRVTRRGPARFLMDALDPRCRERF